MQAYLGEVDRHKLSLVNINRPLSDAEILGRVKATLTGKHDRIDAVFRDMRVEARKSNVETTFESAKQQLIDAFSYDVPDSDKNEKKLSEVPISFTPATSHHKTDSSKHKRGDERASRRQLVRRIFPKGSCKNCPDSTSHTSKYCYKDKRAKPNQHIGTPSVCATRTTEKIANQRPQHWYKLNC